MNFSITVPLSVIKWHQDARWPRLLIGSVFVSDKALNKTHGVAHRSLTTILLLQMKKRRLRDAKQVIIKLIRDAYMNSVTGHWGINT